MSHDLRLPLLNGYSRFEPRLMVIRQFCAAVLVAAAGQAAVAESPPYVPYSGIIRGTEGVVAVTLNVRNATDAPIRCEAALAHRYSVNLGEATAGGTITVTLWHDPTTGRLDLLNETQDRMPVEALWCGYAPRLHATRGRVALPFVIGASPDKLVRTCTPGEAGRVACSESEG